MRITDNHTLGYFGNMMSTLFCDIANQDPSEKVTLGFYPKELKEYAMLPFKNSEVEYLYETPLEKFEVEDTKKVLVGFSGGKDSIAVVLRLQKMGYEPILFHVRGVNRQYLNESDASIILAEQLNVPIIVYDVKHSGKTFYYENPIKNQYILALMLDYGIKNNISRYANGNHSKMDISEANLLYNFSDSLQTYTVFEEFVKKSFPSIRIYFAILH